MSAVPPSKAASQPRSMSLEDLKIQALGLRSSRLWLVSVALATAMICMPFIRAIFLAADEGIVLHGADRILQGSRLYVDFFEFLPPGGFVLTALWFDITGISILNARILAILTIVGIACFTYLACRLVSRNAPLSAFFVIGWVIMSQGVWTQVSHHWFTTFFAMAGAWAALASLEAPPRYLRWPLIAGAAAGTAGMITPTRGALATLAALTAFLSLRRDRAETIAYVLGVALVPAAILVYLALNGSLVAAFDNVIRWTSTRYAAIQYVSFGSFVSPQNYPLLILFPLVAVLTLLVCISDWRSALRDRSLHLCAAFGIAGFLGCFPRPDITHIAFSAPLVYPLLALCVRRLGTSWRPPFRLALAAAAIVLHIPPLLALLWLARVASSGELVSTPRGDFQLFFQYPGQPEAPEKLLARIAATPPRDSFFFYPYLPMVPFLTGREHAAKHDVFLPYYTLPSQYHDACLSAMRRAPWVVVDHTWIGPGKWQEGYPAMPDALPWETIEFERALDRGFEFVAQDGTFEFRRRRKDVGDEICAGLVEK
jgi:hypothetical protein